MKHIFLNLKRFDIPKEYGGVNQIAPARKWGSHIIKSTQEELKKYQKAGVEFVMYFPEAHIISAAEALCKNSPIKVGCQGVYREDIMALGNFGAFTTNRTAKSMKAIGASSAMIGHCEERRDKAGVLLAAGLTDSVTVNRILNKEVKMAVSSGLSVLYCIGETSEEQDSWQDVLREQIEVGLLGVDLSHVTVAYEPVWAVGPGKTPPDQGYIRKIGDYVKEITGGIDVVYGGGLKADNAQMLASVPEMDGGLIALTRFKGEIGFYPEEYLEIIKTYMGY